MLKNVQTGIAFRKSFKRGMPDLNAMDKLFSFRFEIVAAAEQKLNRAEGEIRELTPDENAAYDAFEKLLDVVNLQISHRKDNSIEGPLAIDGEVIGPERPFGSSRGSNTNFTSALQTRTEDPRKVTFRSLFPHIQLATRAAFDTWGKLFVAVGSGRHHPELEEARTMLLGSGPLGGYTASAQLASAVVDGIIEQSRILQLCNVIPGGESGEVRIPVYDNSDHSVSLYGGISRQFLGENSTATPSDAKVRLVSLILHRLCIHTNITNILLQATPAMEMQIRQILIEALTYAIEEAILVGTGINQPRGIVDSPGSVLVSRTTANAIAYADIVNMFSRLAPGSKARAVWVANYNTLPSLLTMQDPSGQYVWSPGYAGAAASMPASLLGREIIFTEKSPALGSKGDIVLCDFKGYAVCLTPQIGVQTSDAVRWYENERSFRIETRVDGTMLLDEPIVPRKGSDTLSTTVVLNA